MNNRAIKYFLLIFTFTKLLLAQDVVTEKELPSAGISPSDNSAVKLIAEKKLKIINNVETKDYTAARNILMEHPINLAPSKKTIEVSAFNMLSASFRSNVRFGGFWEKWAIINFSPTIYLSPFSFINIYADRKISCFIPMTAIKDEVKNLCIQGAAILAVDNAFRFLIKSDDIIPAITNFALKNIVLTLVNNSINHKKGSEVFEQNSIYYAMSIRF